MGAVLALSLNAYVLLAGADFGGGVWDLLASGPRRERQREVISHAIGPIWEANHVWLILAIVLTFSCFPSVFARLGTVLHILWGWAVPQSPYLAPPDLTIARAAAPPATLRLTLIALGLGIVVLLPSLVYLFRVFKAAPSHSVA